MTGKLIQPKAAVRRHVGLWPALEWRKKLTTVPSGVAHRRFERSEIDRLRITPVPRARVAVVIPTFNRPELLLRAIRSALEQTYQNLVVVVVDDGGRLPHIDHDDRVIVVSLSHNTGTAGLVRNIGMGLVESEYLAFLDDDNSWTEDHVQLLVEHLDAHPSLRGAYTSVVRLRPDGTERDTLGEEFSRERLKEDSYIDMNSLMVRRSDRTRFSVLPRTGVTPPPEDWEFVWRLSRSADFEHLDAVTVRYLLNPGSYFAKWQPDELATEP